MIIEGGLGGKECSLSHNQCCERRKTGWRDHYECCYSSPTRLNVSANLIPTPKTHVASCKLDPATHTPLNSPAKSSSNLFSVVQRDRKVEPSNDSRC